VSKTRPSLGAEIRNARFETIFRGNHARVLAYSLRRSADLGQAEEVVSETFLIAWRRLNELPAEPLPWLLGTARRVLANQRRSSRRRFPDGPLASLDAVDAEDSASSIAERVAEREALVAAFASLRSQDRELLALIAWEGLAVREAAAVVGCSAAVFSVRLHRARRRLLKALGETGHALGEESERATPQRPAERTEVQ
jgi:RNA polymerase sigma factor (sigma-70 family)